MKKTNQIISIHLGVLVLYTLFFAILVNASGSGNEPYKWLGFMLLQAIMMIGHGATIIVLAITQSPDKPEYAKAPWLSLLFLVLLGGSFCFVLPGVFAS